MKKLRYPFLFLCGALPLVTFCQTTNPTEVPKIVPPTPQTAQFTKYVDFPADLSIGMANTNIPIYTIETNELSVPITLSYDASGLKPNEDETGVIGLKWSLNAFGVVSRSVNNKRDELYFNSDITNAIDLGSLPNFCEPAITTEHNYSIEHEYLRQVSIGDHDQEPDIYTYKLPNGNNNKFVLSKGSTLNDVNPILLKLSSDKVDFDRSGTFGHFVVTDTKGIQYRFGKNLSGTDNVTESGSKGITSWLLTEMVSPTKKDTIYFEYDNVLFYNLALGEYYGNKYKKLATFTQATNIYKQNPIGSSSTSQTQYVTSQTPIEYAYSQKKITKIRFKSGHVDFIYQFIDHQDVLQYIKVYNSSGKLIRNVELQQSKFQNVTINQLNWLKLDKIRILDDLASQSQDYSFDYITGIFPTNHHGKIPSHIPYAYALSFAIDHWGFYNGKNSNNGLIPTDIDLTWPQAEIYSISSNIGGNRAPDSNYSKIGLLQSITFPAGGTRAFEYEGNTYKDNNTNNNPIGGVRIKRIKNVTQGDEIIHTYDYGLGGDSRAYSVKDFYRTYSYTFHDPIHSTQFLDEWFSISSQPSVDILLNGVPVVYRTVDEYIGSPTINQGKIAHTFNGGGLSLNTYPYTVLPYCALPTSSQPPPISNPKYSLPIPRYFYTISFPEVNEMNTVYYNSQNEIVRKAINGYLNNSFGEAMKGFKSEQVVKVIENWDTHTKETCSSFLIYNYSIEIRHNEPGSTTVTEYENNVPTNVASTVPEYNNKYLVSSQTVSTSTGGHVKTSYLYPFDLVGVEQGPYMQSLVNANRISAPVVTIQSRIDGNNVETKLSEHHIKYGLSANTGNILLPTEVHAKKGTGPININVSGDKSIEFSSYDANGNLTMQRQADGTYTSYVWGYDGQYPIAKLENLLYTSIPAGTITDLGNKSKADGDTCTDSGSCDEKTLRTALNGLRASFPLAMVTTYTYDPLIGVTSVTDPKGYTVYYGYDGFGRLEVVRDAGGKLLSKNEYHYKDQ